MKSKKYFIIVPILMLLAIPLVVMLLWNHVIVAIFAIKAISYFQALGLFVFCRILFGSFGFNKNRKPPFANRDFREKWLSMSSEEREQFKAEWKKRKNNCN